MRFAIALAAASWCARAQEPCAAPTQWTPCDFVFTVAPGEANPPQLHGEFRSPRHKTYLIPAFWDGGNRYILRITPTEPGGWNYRFTSNIPRWHNKEGKFYSAPSAGLNRSFIRNVNVHHWQTLQELQPHLWMGDAIDRIGFVSQQELASMLDKRATEGFTHIRGLLLGDEKDQSHTWSHGQPNVAYFQELDRRLLAVNAKGMVFDAVLADHPAALKALFPTWQDREKYIQYITSRYAGFNITWQMTRSFEGAADGRPMTKELGLLIRKHDPYEHPKTAGAAITSSPLLGDQWMNYITSTGVANDLGSIEHQLYQLPFVNAITASTDEGQRKALWNSSMNGAYPVRAGGPESAAKYWKIWKEFFANTRYWELEPYFYVDGGRAVALVRDFGDYEEAEGIEYIVYIDKPGPLEISVKKHGYDARWVDPATGEVIKIKEFKAERFVGEPPSKDHDWILHLSRDGRKAGMLKSYKFESRPVPVQDIEAQPKMVPYEIVTPSENDLSVSKEIPFSVKLKRDTRGTRTMLYLWTGEVVADGQGFRVLGTGKEGTFRIPRDIVKNLPAVLSLRVSALNANGKIYSIDRIYKLVP